MWTTRYLHFGKDNLNLDLDETSSISSAEQGDEAAVVDIETRVSVVGGSGRLTHIPMEFQLAGGPSH